MCSRKRQVYEREECWGKSIRAETTTINIWARLHASISLIAQFLASAVFQPCCWCLPIELWHPRHWYPVHFKGLTNDVTKGEWRNSSRCHIQFLTPLIKILHFCDVGEAANNLQHLIGKDRHGKPGFSEFQMFVWPISQISSAFNPYDWFSLSDERNNNVNAVRNAT